MKLILNLTICLYSAKKSIVKWKSQIIKTYPMNTAVIHGLIGF